MVLSSPYVRHDPVTPLVCQTSHRGRRAQDRRQIGQRAIVEDLDLWNQHRVSPSLHGAVEFFGWLCCRMVT